VLVSDKSVKELGIIVPPREVTEPPAAIKSANELYGGTFVIEQNAF
jgi:hypothetical protein